MKQTHFYIFLLALMSVFCVSIKAQDAGKEANVVIVQDKDSTEHVFYFSAKPVITFDATSFTVSDGDKQFLFDDVLQVYFSYKDNPATKISNVMPDEKIVVSGNTVMVNGEDPFVKVYSINGIEQPISVNHTGSGVSFSLDSLPRGIYIIKTKHQSFKINKK